MEMVKPHFDDDAALRIWIEKQLEKVMKEYAMQFRVSPAAGTSSKVTSATPAPSTSPAMVTSSSPTARQ